MESGLDSLVAAQRGAADLEAVRALSDLPSRVDVPATGDVARGFYGAAEAAP
ncbi:hypothetical protein [Lentzea jiangxiensis]|uniref:hypothetical protein n=1 Tax=Lentzea jiangxiensis TaxID=641025 RepID=UPI0015A0F707|nr:hypothetical protein [Lentzea jiangxiensis]